MREKHKLKMARLFCLVSDSKSLSLCWLKPHGEGKQVIARAVEGKTRIKKNFHVGHDCLEY